MDAQLSISTFIGEVGRWFSHPGSDIRRRPEGSSPISVNPITSPAAPDQTVQPFSGTPAFRHRSSQCMRSRVAHRPGESYIPGLPASPM